MVGTIGLAGSKARAQGTWGRWWLRLGSTHILAAMTAGALAGAVVAIAGGLLRALLPGGHSIQVGIPVLAAGVILLFAVFEVAGVPAKYLARARQVPMSWKQIFPAPMSSALYGAVLGFGFLSTVYSWSFFALMTAVFLRGSVAAGLAAGAAFGLGRSLPVIATSSVPGTEKADSLADRAAAFFARERVISRGSGALLIVAAGAALLRWGA